MEEKVAELESELEQQRRRGSSGQAETVVAQPPPPEKPEKDKYKALARQVMSKSELISSKKYT